MDFVKFYRYQSISEARSAYCLKMLRYLGIREGSVEHQQILDDYNKLAKTPQGLPRGWKALPTDAWCAEFVSGQAHVMGLTEIYPMECGCNQIIEIAQRMGIWIEADDYIPMPGDWVLFSTASPAGENRERSSHVGAVYYSDGEIIITVEGNKSNAVGTRAMAVGAANIRGYVHPDYSQLVGSVIAPPAVQEPPAVEPPVAYRTLVDIPEFGKATIAKMVESGWILGVDSDNLGISADMLRMLVILDRAGVFGATK